jgi:O-antigen ligase
MTSALRFRAPPWPIAIFVLLQVGAAVMSPVGGSYAVHRAVNWVMFVPLACVAYGDRMRRLVCGWIIAAATVTTVGVVTQMTGALGGTWGGLSVGGGKLATRYTGFLLNPNDAGLLLLLGGVCAYLLVKPRWLGLVVASCLSAALLLTASRGGLLALPLVLAALFLQEPRRVGLLACGAVLATIVIGYLSPSMGASFRATLASIPKAAAGNDESLSARETTWRQSLQNSGGVLGGGYGGYAADPAALRFTTMADRQTTYRTLTVDNSWLKLWLEEGVWGVGLVLIVFVIAMRAGFRRRDPVGLAVACSLVAIMFRSFSTDILDISPWNIYLWLLIGVALSGGLNRGGYEGLARRRAMNNSVVAASGGPAA